MTIRVQPVVRPEACPALVLNADDRPLSYDPLSLRCPQDAVKAVFSSRANIVSDYDKVVRSPTLGARLPSVISLKTGIKPARPSASTRFNVSLRARFSRRYCSPSEAPTRDYAIRRPKGGQTTVHRGRVPV